MAETYTKMDVRIARLEGRVEALRAAGEVALCAFRGYPIAREVISKKIAEIDPNTLKGRE